LIAKFTLSAMMVILSVGTNNSLRANTKHFDRTTQAGFIAFLGDSLSTGAVAHPDLALTQAAMKSVLAGTMSYAPDEVYWEKVKEAGFLLDSGSEADPRRLYLASREFKDPMGWFLDHVGLVFSHKYLDAERYAWSYFLGRSLGYEPDSVWIAAKDGEKAEHATAQMARVLDESQGEAPDHIFMFFTGNDLCAATPEKKLPNIGSS
jgi:lysophospholipase L1-like esterase